MQTDKFRLQVWFSGRVQGVGFRFKTLEISKGYEVSGFVENLDDGRVHLCAVGEEAEVREFAEDLKRTMSPFIKDADERRDFCLPYKGFSIKH